MGHPLGATGAVLATKLVHELQRTGGTRGLQTMCEGGDHRAGLTPSGHGPA
jgi:acetyl-CoA C-acetyltransferase